MTRFLLPLLLLSFAACSRPNSSPLDVSGENIINGERVASDDPLRAFTPQIVAPNGKGTCSSVLIEQDIVLTAAHCISSIKAEVMFKGPEGSTSIGISRTRCTYSQREIESRIKKIDRLFGKILKKNIEHDDFEKYELQDFCALKLKKPAPKSAKPIAIATVDSLATGSPIIFLGYGRASNTGNDFGVLRKAVASFAGFTKHFAFTESGKRTDRICFGDSGGPAIIYNDFGKPELVGVVTQIYGDYGDKDTCTGSHYQSITRAVSMYDLINNAR